MQFHYNVSCVFCHVCRVECFAVVDAFDSVIQFLSDLFFTGIGDKVRCDGHGRLCYRAGI